MATKKATKKVVNGSDRKAGLLEIGARLAAKHGAKNVTRRMVAKQAKVSEALVTHHMGSREDAQKAYVRQAKKMGLELPTKEQADAIGAKLRAHGPRKADAPKRKRSAKEVEAIRRNVKAKEQPVAKKTAARKPKTPPTLPPLLPAVPVVPALPALPVAASETQQ